MYACLTYVYISNVFMPIFTIKPIGLIEIDFLPFRGVARVKYTLNQLGALLAVLRIGNARFELMIYRGASFNRRKILKVFAVYIFFAFVN